jgi:hypothetical protein
MPHRLFDGDLRYAKVAGAVTVTWLKARRFPVEKYLAHQLF